MINVRLSTSGDREGALIADGELVEGRQKEWQASQKTILESDNVFASGGNALACR